MQYNNKKLFRTSSNNSEGGKSYSDNKQCDKVNYLLSDGQVVQIDLTRELREELDKLDKRQRYSNWKERRLGAYSLNDPKRNGIYILDKVNRNPEELYLESLENEMKRQREQSRQEIPLMDCLTDYQKRVAIKYYIQHMSQTDIACEEGVNKSNISRLIKKIQKKLIYFFT